MCQGVLYRLGTSIELSPSILIRVHAVAHTPGMEGNGLKAVEHLAGLEELELCALRNACDRRRIPTEIVQRSTECRGSRYLFNEQCYDLSGPTLMFHHEWVAGLRMDEERSLAILRNP